MQVGAWLIQSVTGYLAEMEPQLSQVLARHGVAQRDEFVLWLVRREMMEVYFLYEHRTLSMGPFMLYEQVYQALRTALPFNLQSCFTHYFKAPRLYDSAAIEVHLRKPQVICIGYLTNLKKFYP